MSLQAPRPKVGVASLLLGVAAAQLVGGLLALLGRALSNPQNGGVLVSTLFLVVPVVMGLASAFVWRREPMRGGLLTLMGLANTVVALALAAAFLSEGVICLVIALPLLWGAHLVGLFLGRAIFAPREGKSLLRVSAAPALVAMLVIDSRMLHLHRGVVVTRSAPIHASPMQLWPKVVAFGTIAAPPTFWLCRLGLPAPETVRADSDRVGARRDCLFTGNLVFGEKIVVSEPGRRLSFDIVSQPRDPEILGHADVTRGEMELIDNGDGTTTIVGRSWYRLYVFPTAYFDLWAQAIGHGVHERVFEHLARTGTTGQLKQPSARGAPTFGKHHQWRSGYAARHRFSEGDFSSLAQQRVALAALPRRKRRPQRHGSVTGSESRPTPRPSATRLM